MTKKELKQIIKESLKEFTEPTPKFKVGDIVMIGESWIRSYSVIEKVQEFKVDEWKYKVKGFGDLLWEKQIKLSPKQDKKLIGTWEEI